MAWPVPWPGAPDPQALAGPDLYEHPAEEVARRLLGARVVSTVGGERTVGVVVETEAYVGPHDDASHAAERIGRTQRNDAMFGPPGSWYVYRSHGLHHCLNLVTDQVGFPAAVLVRALDPIEGHDVMVRRRGRAEGLCAGPGNLAKSLGVTLAQNGLPVGGVLTVEGGWVVPDSAVGRSPRIGISRAVDLPLRFFVRGHQAVKSPRW